MKGSLVFMRDKKKPAKQNKVNSPGEEGGFWFGAPVGAGFCLARLLGRVFVWRAA